MVIYLDDQAPFVEFDAPLIEVGYEIVGYRPGPEMLEEDSHR